MDLVDKLTVVGVESQTFSFAQYSQPPYKSSQICLSTLEQKGRLDPVNFCMKPDIERAILANCIPYFYCVKSSGAV